VDDAFMHNLERNREHISTTRPYLEELLRISNLYDPSANIYTEFRVHTALVINCRLE
jgi:hypothetical protein